MFVITTIVFVKDEKWHNALLTTKSYWHQFHHRIRNMLFERKTIAKSAVYVKIEIELHFYRFVFDKRLHKSFQSSDNTNFTQTLQPETMTSYFH